jgi:hypothetical protein
VKTRNIITGVAGVLLAGAAATGFLGWKAEREKVEDLEKEVEALRLQERRSAVDRSVSKQMEELANEPRDINQMTREEWEALPFLTPQQVEQLVAKRRQSLM